MIWQRENMLAGIIEMMIWILNFKKLFIEVDVRDGRKIPRKAQCRYTRISVSCIFYLKFGNSKTYFLMILCSTFEFDIKVILVTQNHWKYDSFWVKALNSKKGKYFYTDCHKNLISAIILNKIKTNIWRQIQITLFHQKIMAVSDKIFSLLRI